MNPYRTPAELPVAKMETPSRLPMIVTCVAVMAPLIALNYIDPLAREFWTHPSPESFAKQARWNEPKKVATPVCCPCTEGTK